MIKPTKADLGRGVIYVPFHCRGGGTVERLQSLQDYVDWCAPHFEKGKLIRIALENKAWVKFKNNPDAKLCTWDDLIWAEGGDGVAK